jgi:hypothetical protein
MTRRIAADHGIVCRVPDARLGYFGWPTVARLDDGTLYVVASGLRSQHVCPWGKTTLCVSHDDGTTWTPPRVINDSTLDDRDAGLVNLGGGSLLLTWFTSDTRQYATPETRAWLGDEEVDAWREALARMTDDVVAAELGSWAHRSDDAGATWGPPVRVPVSAPHGPIRLGNGDLLYLGKQCGTWDEMLDGDIQACRSTDGGRTWQPLGTVPRYPNTVGANYHEPHVVELPSGRLLGAIRAQDGGGVHLERDAGVPGGVSIMLTTSDDGGGTWSPAAPLGFHAVPPHLLRHSSGTLVLTYGYREAPCGQRVAFSTDDGRTWTHDWILRDDGPDFDLGYPSTVELADGRLFTVYYQRVPGDAKTSLLWSRWTLPA